MIEGRAELVGLELDCRIDGVDVLLEGDLDGVKFSFVFEGAALVGADWEAVGSAEC